MAITLGSITFDEGLTQVQEKYEEVGGRDERIVTISGILTNESSVADIDALLDAILDAASVEDFTAELSLRSGRRLFVRRNAYSRSIARDARTGSFTLELKAEIPFEESTALTSVPWTVTASGDTQAATGGGTAFSLPILTLVASGTIVNPSFSDGTRIISYSGTVADGETLVFDAVQNVVTLEGLDVTPYTSGLCPYISPEGTTLMYTDDAASSHTASVTLDFRDRWW